jgi:hypothetical protein
MARLGPTDLIYFTELLSMSVFFSDTFYKKVVFVL